MKAAIFIVILVMGVSFTVLKCKEDGPKNIALGIISTIALSVFSSYIYDSIKSELDKFNQFVHSSAIFNHDTGELEDMEDGASNHSAEDEPDMEEPGPPQYDNLTDSQEPTFEPSFSANFIEDVSAKASFSGRITTEDQKDNYKYISTVDGTYRFDTNLSSGGSVIVRISGENEDSIEYDYDSLSIDLEAGKTYILSVEYQNGPCDYTVNIGSPISITDISNDSSISGSITYQDQKDKYYYTAPTSGTYHFDANMSSGGSIIIRISGENMHSIEYNYDALSIDLEAGKTYVLSAEYQNGPCDYTVNIGIPIPITDISDNPSSITGSITYQDQKDKYYYTAPVSGTYRFNTNLSSGGSVLVRISGENGNPIDYNYDALTIDLEEGKKYILSIEYRESACDYVINTGVPIPITNISNDAPISGSITYQDQKNKYYYTAPASGTYHFSTNLSSGGSVIVRISGENSKSIDSDYDKLSIDLEAGKNYILSIEYRNGFCDYETSIQTP